MAAGLWVDGAQSAALSAPAGTGTLPPTHTRRQPLERRRNPFIYITGVFAGAWAAAAWFRPDADFVVFPILVAASFPISYRLAMGPLPTPLAGGAAVAGTINVIVVALLLELAGLLGPARLLPDLGAVGQATVLGALGGITGFLVSRGTPDRAG